MWLINSTASLLGFVLSLDLSWVSIGCVGVKVCRLDVVVFIGGDNPAVAKFGSGDGLGDDFGKEPFLDVDDWSLEFNIADAGPLSLSS